MPSRQQLHDTIDRLPDAELLPALRYLEFLANFPPPDDEPYSDAERAEDEIARQDLARGERVTLAEMKREFGL
jgi:hypothetical protein